MHVPRNLVLGEMLGVEGGSKAELSALVSGVLAPLDAVLTVAKAELGTVLCRGDGQKATEQNKAALASRLSEEISTLLKGLEDNAQLKAVIVYPLTIATLNTWRNISPNFADMVINAVKANEPDKKLRTLIEQMDMPVTQNQIRRN
jgi:hypothetical protein